MRCNKVFLSRLIFFIDNFSSVFTIPSKEAIMPRTAEQNLVLKEKRKKRLLEISLKMFATKGYAAVTTDSISKGARVSHGLFYHYFSSKDDAFQATVNHFILGANSPFLTAKAMEAYHGVEGLKKYFEVSEKIQTGEPDDLYMAKIILDMERGLAKGSSVKETIVRYDIFGTFERLIGEGQNDGDVIAGDPKEIARAFFDMFVGLVDSLLASEPSKKKGISKDTLLAMTLKKPL